MKEHIRQQAIGRRKATGNRQEEVFTIAYCLLPIAYHEILWI